MKDVVSTVPGVAVTSSFSKWRELEIYKYMNPLVTTVLN
jgi:hypothetical protein